MNLAERSRRFRRGVARLERLEDRLAPHVGIDHLDLGEFYRSGGRVWPLYRQANQLAVRVQPSADLRAVVGSLTAADGPLAGFSLLRELTPQPIAVFQAPSAADGGAGLRLTAADPRIDAVNSWVQVDWAAPVYHNPANPDGWQIVSDKLVVALKAGESPETVFGRDGRFSSYRPLWGAADEFVVTVNAAAGPGTLQVAEELSGDDRISWASPDFYQQWQKFITNDPLINSQWHLNNTGQTGGVPGADVRAFFAWAKMPGPVQGGSPNVVVSIIDDAVELEHPDLKANIFINPNETADNKFDDDLNGWVDDVRGYDFVNYDNDPNPGVPDDNHGTAVAGVTAAVGQNTVGVAGAAFKSRILPIRIGLGGTYTSDSDIATAVRYGGGINKTGAGLWANIHITNNSWGGGGDSAAIRTAFTTITTQGRGGKGTLSLIANGNNGSGTISFPAYLAGELKGVIAVGASTDSDIRSSYSQYGPQIDFVAPSSGGNFGIVTTDRAGDKGYNPAGDYTNTAFSAFGGTSSATPLASGVAALIFAIDPNLTASQVRLLMRATTDYIGPDFIEYDKTNFKSQFPTTGWNQEYGFGRVNAVTAVQGVGRAAIQVFQGRDAVADETGFLSFNGLTETTQDITFRVRNQGTKDLLLGQINLTPPGPFSVQKSFGSTVLSIGQQTEFTIRFRPTADGTVDTKLSFPTNVAGDAAVYDFILSGTGIVPTIRGQAFEDFDGDGLRGPNEPPLSDWIVFLDENNNGALDRTSFTSNDVGQIIDGKSVVRSKLFVTGFGELVEEMTVRLDIEHTWNADLNVFLIAPSGQRVELFTNVGADRDNFFGTILDDRASISITEGFAPFTGRFRPEGKLSNFQGINPNGAWTLEITDVWVNNDNGRLRGWGLDLNSRETIADSIDVPQLIEDLKTTKSNLVIADARGPIFDVDVRLSIQHTWTSDLSVFLIGPNGARVELFSGISEAGINFTKTVLDDQAAKSITQAKFPHTGRFRPVGRLSTFNGLDPNGTWTLEISDIDLGVQGKLIEWGLDINAGSTSEPIAFTDVTGSYGFQQLPPGNYTVRRLVEPGWNPSPGSPESYTVSVVTGAERFSGLDFGGVLQNAVYGRVFNDTNANGQLDNGEVGLKNWTVYLDLNHDGKFNSTAQKFATDVPLPVNDLETKLSPLVVSGVGGKITGAEVSLNINHNYVADLDVYLIAPDGTRVELFTDVGGGFANFKGTILDDNAATSIAAGVAPFTGRFRPEGKLSDFNGMQQGYPRDPNGIWYLEVTDDTNNGIGGVVTDWSLTLRSDEPTLLTNELGQYRFTDRPAYTHPSADVPRLIADNAVTISDLKVLNLDGKIHDLNLRLTLDHPNPADLQAFLVAPTGAKVQLFANLPAGGTQFQNALFDDQATNTLSGSPAPYTLSYKPAQPLNTFADLSPNGIWRLQLVDGPQSNLTTIKASSPDVPLTIPVNGTVSSKLTLSNVIGGADDVNVLVSLVHPNPTDLSATLIAPDGTRVRLISGLPVGATQLTNTTFDDQATSLIFAGKNPFTASFKPAEPLSGLSMTDPDGDWYLELSDGKAANAARYGVNLAGSPLAIADGKLTTSNVQVSHLPAVVQNVAVTLSLDHPNPTDLRAELVAPNGKIVPLFTTLPAAATTLTDTVFSDAGTDPISKGAPPYTATFRPAEPLALFKNINPNGQWSLRLIDGPTVNAAGSLFGWSIDLTTPATLGNWGLEVRSAATLFDWALDIDTLLNTAPVRVLLQNDFLQTAPAAGGYPTFFTAGDTLTKADFGVVFSPGGVGVTVNQADDQPDPSGGAVPVRFIAKFSVPVVGFTASDVVIGGTTGAANVQITDLTGFGTTYAIDVSGFTKSGALTASIPAGVATSTSGLPNLASTSTDNSVTVDITPPSAFAALSNVTTMGGTAYSFAVTYTDNTAVDVSLIGDNDIRVTGPNGFLADATLSKLDLNSNGSPRVAIYSITPPGGTWTADDNGTYAVALRPNTIADVLGNLSPGGPLGTFTVGVVSPPQVSQLLVNDGALQRSMVTSLTVQFDRAMTFVGNTADAFALVRTGPGTPAGLVGLKAALLPGTPTAVRLTYHGAMTGPMGSLLDGEYLLTVFADRVWANGVMLDGDADGKAGGNFTTTLYRFTGDANGDKRVDFQDYLLYRAAFGSAVGAPAYRPYFDFNADDQVDFADFLQFRTRFGTQLP